MMVVSQDRKLVANYERNIWKVDGKCIYLIYIDSHRFLEFARFETDEEAIEQLGFMVEREARGYPTYEFNKIRVWEDWS